MKIISQDKEHSIYESEIKELVISYFPHGFNTTIYFIYNEELDNYKIRVDYEGRVFYESIKYKKDVNLTLQETISKYLKMKSDKDQIVVLNWFKEMIKKYLDIKF